MQRIISKPSVPMGARVVPDYKSKRMQLHKRIHEREKYAHSRRTHPHGTVSENNAQNPPGGLAQHKGRGQTARVRNQTKTQTSTLETRERTRKEAKSTINPNYQHKFGNQHHSHAYQHDCSSHRRGAQAAHSPLRHS